MKTKIVLFFFILFICKIHAQEYFIDFVGAGDANYIETVLVQNVTQGTDLELTGNDILLLSITAGFETMSNYNNGIFIYPNPMTLSSIIEFSLNKAGNCNIEVYDAIGKRVLNINQNLNAGIHRFQIHQLQSGIYNIIVHADGVTQSGKIVSQSNHQHTPAINYLHSEPFMITPLTLKSTKELVPMYYEQGDQLIFTFNSGDYTSVVSFIPSANTTMTVYLYECADGDDKNYATVTIGEQIWMAENLSTKKYSNGDPIAYFIDELDWENATEGAWLYVDDDDSNIDVYGLLYNFNAVVDSRNICPAGWKVPSDNDWKILEMHLGMTQEVANELYWRGTDEGGKLKDAIGLFWNAPNEGANNISGFTALPAGWVDDSREFYDLGVTGSWWTSTAFDSEYAFYRSLAYDNAMIMRPYYLKNSGFSIRCIKD